RYFHVTGVQTCALPIFAALCAAPARAGAGRSGSALAAGADHGAQLHAAGEHRGELGGEPVGDAAHGGVVALVQLQADADVGALGVVDADPLDAELGVGDPVDLGQDLRVVLGVGDLALLGQHGEEAPLDREVDRPGDVHHHGVGALVQRGLAGLGGRVGRRAGVGAPPLDRLPRGEGQYAAAAGLAEHDRRGDLALLVALEAVGALLRRGGDGDHGDEQAGRREGGEDLAVPDLASGVLLQSGDEFGVGRSVVVEEALSTG